MMTISMTVGAFWCEKPCDNCPYTPGSESSRFDPTAERAKMCVTQRIPFMCHQTMKRVPIGKISGHTIYEDYPSKVCAGWIREITNQGNYENEKQQR